MTSPQTILVLGGGFYPDGTLTTLSRQRLDRAAELFQQKAALTITTLGERKSTYSPDAIEFDEPGAEKRARYLMDKGIPSTAIHKIIGGRDTIGEAIACRNHLPALRITSLILVTSTLHMPRALWVFRTVLGSGYTIIPDGVDCGRLLLADEEADYLTATQKYFSTRPSLLEKTDNWIAKNSDLYDSFKKIHDRHHSSGQTSEAYCAVHPTEVRKNDPDHF